MSSVTGTMEHPKAASKKPAVKRQLFLKKLDAETARVLASLKDRANKKPFGRKIRDAEILALGVSLIETSHLNSLQEKSYSETDRLQMLHDGYQKKSGKIPLDEFIGKILRREITLD